MVDIYTVVQLRDNSVVAQSLEADTVPSGTYRAVGPIGVLATFDSDVCFLGKVITLTCSGVCSLSVVYISDIIYI